MLSTGCPSQPHTINLASQQPLCLPQNFISTISILGGCNKTGVLGSGDHNCLTCSVMASSKAGTRAEGIPAAEPVLVRLFVAPILFVSFLISLFIIDRHHYGKIFSNPESKSDYYHSHQRKLAKTEMDEAFLLRRKVIVGFCVFSAVSLALFAWGIESMWHIWKVRI